MREIETIARRDGKRRVRCAGARVPANGGVGYFSPGRSEDVVGGVFVHRRVRRGEASEDVDERRRRERKRKGFVAGCGDGEEKRRGETDGSEKDSKKRDRDDPNAFVAGENAGRVAGWKRGEFELDVH